MERNQNKNKSDSKISSIFNYINTTISKATTKIKNNISEKDTMSQGSSKSSSSYKIDLNNNISIIKENYVNNIENVINNNQDTTEINFDFLESVPVFSKIVSKAKKLSCLNIQKKVYEILELISQGGFNSIDSIKLQNLMHSGLPDELPGLRTLLWKLSLNYPSNAKVIHTPKWQEEIDLKRDIYRLLKDKHYRLIIDLKKEKARYFSLLNKENNIENSLHKNNNLKEQYEHPNYTLSINTKDEYKDNKSYINSNHPLDPNVNSDWNIYFNDLELLEEIEKDVRRTRAQMSFFFMPVDPEQDVSNQDIAFKADQIREPSKKNKNMIYKFETHCDVLTRILYIYAKEFPNVRYVQGMNEVLAPIYYQFCIDNGEDNNQFKENFDSSGDSLNSLNAHKENELKEFEKIEADSYYCFKNLMSEIKDLFIREKDITKNGIQNRIKVVNILLSRIDKRLYEFFINVGIELQFFMFRWYTLLFTQEYEMPDVLRLWDSVLSYTINNEKNIDKFSFLNYLCISLILVNKDKVIDKEFADVMLSYQQIEEIEVSHHIKLASEVMNYFIINGIV